MKLRLAAKSRLNRMMKTKTKRRGMNVPDWRKQEWETGNRNMIAQLLCDSNFNKDIVEFLNESTTFLIAKNNSILCFKEVLCMQEVFMNSWQTIVKKKKKIALKVEEGWYSEAELRDEVGWSTFLPHLVFFFRKMCFHLHAQTNERVFPLHPSFSPGFIVYLREKINGAKKYCMTLAATHVRTLCT